MSVQNQIALLDEHVRKGSSSTRVHGLAGISIAHTVLDFAQHRPVVLLARSIQAAEEHLRDLRALAGQKRSTGILSLHADERTPYHTSSPDPLLVMERTATLYKIATDASFEVLVLPPEAAFTRSLPFEALQEMGEWLVEGTELDRDAVLEKLALGGYTRVNTVEDPGTFALRGSILDIFWPGERMPVRIDLFGEEIDSIRHFDPATQRATDELEEFSFGPVKEVHLTDAASKRAKQRLRDLADDTEFPTRKLKELLADIDNRIPFFGIEGLLPAFFERIQTPLEFLEQGLKQDFTLVLDDKDAIAATAKGIGRHYRDLHRSALDRGDLCFPVEEFLVDEDKLESHLPKCTQVEFLSLVIQDGSDEPLHVDCPATLDIRKDILKQSMGRDDETAPTPKSLLAPLAQKIRQLHKNGYTVLLPTRALGGVERLTELLKGHALQIRHVKPAPDLMSTSLREDFYHETVHAWCFVSSPTDPARGGLLPHRKVAYIVEDEIFGKRARRSGSSGKKKGFKTTLADLEEGDFIVHVDHGIGEYHGMTRLNLRGVEGDYILLTYAGEDKLYLPVHRINQIQRYSGAEGKKPRIDKLGGTSWSTSKSKVKKAVLAMAHELLNLYAKRELSNRSAFGMPDENYLQFETDFAFEATPDQQKAIDDVVSDMTSDKPMDRLICGDVGYGKTEVGMRGAMLAVNSERQVALLAPTTVLAQQHYLTFKERFRSIPVNIEVISRFRKPKEVKEVIQKAKEGKVDILIGTHRILSTDVGFKNLGLVIVDEEQRFGVKAKEALKKLRASVDLITMTATPIPRTLQMGFFGIRDMSVIETPPVDRRAIRTEVMRFDDDVIREAMLRELNRGGQIYFVHNRVRSIEAMRDYLTRLVPEARIGVGHGQMEEKGLEEVMMKFMKHEINVLLCTTIIETGIDVPTANTMFIDHADEFGLSQLYQLRGRVGRSKERAFAYMLIPGTEERLTPVARKRLEVLQRFSELGAGFKVAQHDLELRGAGDLLGKGQHGHVTTVGYDLYADLLKEAVEQLKGRAHDDAPEPDINLPIKALLPDRYIRDIHERLSMYQRFAAAEDGEAIYDVVGEMSEKFGEPPPEAIALADVMVLKLSLKRLAARALDLGAPAGSPAGTPPISDDENAPPPRVVISLGDNAKLDPKKVLAMTQAKDTRFKLTPSMKLVYHPSDEEWRAVANQAIPLCRDLLRRIIDAAL
ncbi:MAG: transcription-repair coupling factor [Deltaproteobacteria bacterium]|nr:transcription-repair coupling factor [Deltaproteobacteria bacterium]